MRIAILVANLHVRILGHRRRAQARPSHEPLHRTSRHTLRYAPCASMRSSDSLHPGEAREAGGNMGMAI